MIVKANEGQLSSDRKSVQLVVVVGTGINRKSVTVHARNTPTGLFGPNPFYGKSYIEKRHHDAREAMEFARTELDEARKHEQAMYELAFNRKPWMLLTKSGEENAPTWHELAIEVTKDAGERFSIAFNEMGKLEQEFPLTVEFECGKIIPAGKKPKPEVRRLAFA